MPEQQYKEWLFTGEDDSVSCESMVEAISTYALSFMRKNASLEKIDELMESYDFIFRHDRAKKWPVAKLLLGKRGEAFRVMDEYIGLLTTEERTDAIADYKKYCDMVVERVGWIESYNFVPKR